MTKKDDGALRPQFHKLVEQIKKVEDIKTLTADEEVLAAGSVNEFWRILRKHFDNAIEQLEALNDAAIAKGLSEAEIGRNTIVLSLVKGIVKGIVNKVEDAKEALDERGGKK